MYQVINDRKNFIGFVGDYMIPELLFHTFDGTDFIRILLKTYGVFLIKIQMKLVF